MNEQTGVHKSGKSLRRDFRERFASVVGRSRLLMIIDPSFEKELEQLGLDKEKLMALGVNPGAFESVQPQLNDALKGLQRSDEYGRASFKFLRRQLREDVRVLQDEIRLLKQLDPRFQEELSRLDLQESLTSIEKMSAAR